MKLTNRQKFIIIILLLQKRSVGSYILVKIQRVSELN